MRDWDSYTVVAVEYFLGYDESTGEPSRNNIGTSRPDHSVRGRIQIKVTRFEKKSGERELMADQKDRLGDKLHHAERAREDQWARQRDEEIIERLRRKYVKPIHCPQCDKNLDARVAIGVGGMACPFHDGAWGDAEALRQIVARLKNAAAIHHESLGEKAFIRVSELVEDLRHKHPKEIRLSRLRHQT